MNEPLHEKLSLLVDDRLDAEQTLTLLKTIQKDPHLQNKLSRYQIVSQTLKSDVFVSLRADFASGIHQRIQQEPTYFIPQRHRTGFLQKAALAVAASVAVVAIFVARSVDKPQAPISMARQYQPPQMVRIYPVDPRFNDYLQAHNNSLYTNALPHQPYATVAGFQK